MNRRPQPGSRRGTGGLSVNTWSAHSRYRQLTRILRHLRDELHEREPQLAKPTSTMLEQLVANCPLSTLQGNDWSEVIRQALQFLTRHLDPQSFDPQLFYCIDRNAPLFPNDELFDSFDAWLFVTALQRHYSRLDN